ncbi:hypothetical protein GGP41_003357 [Bipolaris sorokiniana]|uniref:FAD/NAD(P)-binding domain-containing protein n=2 Tax=Cochliobolus sativus TaxID=45130 RepID=A0A8H6DTB6_COCSA|nr:uncharacterized protein COCSADRAFT_108920 [Bipolaris sorokiniana ND90Pr]EMD68426.1 hypothetical protein COCSADRAFT_108920 [Bipolaris sorokiniana ND90Pr]KAF5847083.1 hypothetical protein GGP41_003357 [Bipolaris sorokiniana]
MIDSYFDVLIIGGGISGINAAYRIQESLPDVKFTILEARHELGGTWSQFKYPGVRSDSDLYTLGFQFNPWRNKEPIARGENIMGYLKETVQKFDIDKKIRYKHKVLAADWRTDEQRWRVEVEVGNDVGREPRRVTYWTSWLIMGTGYYNYDEPQKADIPGIDNFQGQRIHPQFWPENLDYKDKKIVIIGSGATTITLLPALVDGGAASVTQLQRSPSYIMSIGQKRKSWVEKYAPEWFTLRYNRFMFTLVPILIYKFCIWFPSTARNLIIKQAASQLPPDFPIDPHFKPSYGPWQQRMCLCPDGDYFKAFRSGKAHIVTDTIKTVTTAGIELNSGTKLDADIIITATGLNLNFLGGMQTTVEGEHVDLGAQYMWRASMFTSLPNFGNIIGYWNASWTLGSDAASRLYVRLIKYQRDNGYTSVVPVITDVEKEKSVSASPLNSTYIQTNARKMPQCANTGPWKPRDNYYVDNWDARMGSLTEGLKWNKVAVQ